MNEMNFNFLIFMEHLFSQRQAWNSVFELRNTMCFSTNKEWCKVPNFLRNKIQNFCLPLSFRGFVMSAKIPYFTHRYVICQC